MLVVATATVAADEGLLADLPPDEREALAASVSGDALPDDPGALLQRILLLEPAYRFDAGLVAVDTDRRWFSSQPSPRPGAAVLELRRWPGDTVVSFYVLRGAGRPVGYDPAVPSATLEGPVVTEDLSWWEGTLETRSGPRRVVWVERAVEEGRVHALRSDREDHERFRGDGHPVVRPSGNPVLIESVRRRA